MTSTALPKPEKDPRTMVTPYAFTVDAELLGLPLASPLRRLAGFCIDGLVVLLLSRLGYGAFLIALAFLTFRLWQQADEMAGQRWKNVVRWFLIIAFVLWGGAEVTRQYFQEKVELAEKASEVTVSDAKLSDAEKIAQLEKTIKSLKDSDHEVGVVAGVQNVLTDVGFEFGWAAIYYSLLMVLFNGQTVGKMLFGMRVVQLNGAKLTIWQCFNRYGGYAAGAATGMLGFAQVFWDANRQAIHDKIANTVVIDLRRARYALPATELPPAIANDSSA